MTDSLWHKTLQKCVRELISSGDYPVWLDGFADVILFDHTSDDNDNLYVPQEQPQHHHYRSGALAAESLFRSIEKEGFRD
jgi:hypothetical protein